MSYRWSTGQGPFAAPQELHTDAVAQPVQENTSQAPAGAVCVSVLRAGICLSVYPSRGYNNHAQHRRFSLACLSLSAISSLLVQTLVWVLLLYQPRIKYCLGNTGPRWVYGMAAGAHSSITWGCFPRVSELFLSACPTVAHVSTTRGRARRILNIFLLYKYVLVYICYSAPRPMPEGMVRD